ncbi:MAG: ORF6N domain-containing protein [Planctomycetota bacterium]
MKSKTKKSSSGKQDDGAIVPMERIEQSILLIRGSKVILDKDLAELYGVTTSNLNKAVTRNLDRWRYPQAAPRLHRTGRNHALQRPAEQAGRSGQYPDYAYFCSAA